MGKTAVVVIHGVGEQRPMGTVRSFVRFFAGDFFRSKPDTLADLFELRRLSTYARAESDAVAAARVVLSDYPTDIVFYEYYWAFHYRDTKPALVIRWSAITLARLFTSGQFWRLGRRVLNVVSACLLALLVVTAAVFLVAWGVATIVYSKRGFLGGTLTALGLLLPRVAGVIRPVFLGWVGDASRYFGTSPENPIERQQIRADGVQLLEHLHDRRDAAGALEYDRIIVVGHSLGSVIAYDMITHYWSRVNARIRIPLNSASLNAIEQLIERNEPPTARPRQWCDSRPADLAAVYHAAQTALAREVGNDNWRVTDLVTLGCPLTYARFLLATSAEELEERQLQRELPTCPPTRDQYADENGRRSVVFTYAPVTGPECVVPHHAAPFLLTRWTNLYFPNDPIGGRLRPFFGWGIDDAAVGFTREGTNPHEVRHTRSIAAPLIDVFGGAHVRYWELENDDPMSPLSGECAARMHNIVLDHQAPRPPNE